MKYDVKVSKKKNILMQLNHIMIRCNSRPRLSIQIQVLQAKETSDMIMQFVFDDELLDDTVCSTRRR